MYNAEMPPVASAGASRLAAAALRLLGRGRGQQVLGPAGRVFEDGGEKLLADISRSIIAISRSIMAI